MRGLVEVALPARMGTPFRWLVGSSWVGNLGDGIALAAGPLLVASQTQDPLLVALGALLQRLPWLRVVTGQRRDRVGDLVRGTHGRTGSTPPGTTSCGRRSTTASPAPPGAHPSRTRTSAAPSATSAGPRSRWATAAR